MQKPPKALFITLLLVAAAVAIFLLWPAKTASAKYFSDVPEEHPNSLAIKELSDSGVIAGYEDGTFKPENPVNRAEAAKMILSALNAQLPVEADVSQYSDVEENTWYTPYIAEATKRDIFRGYADGTFKPADEIIFVESLAVILRGFDAPFQTVQGGVWYSPYLNFAKENLLFNPTQEENIEHTVNRGEFAEIVYRLKWSKDNSYSPFDLTQDFEYFFKPSNRYQLRYPQDWNLHEGVSNSTFYKLDEVNNQVWYTKIYPNGARLSASYVYLPDHTADSFFIEMKNAQSQFFTGGIANQENLTLYGRQALQITNPSKRTIDTFISMPGSHFLVFYAEYGGGTSAWFYEAVIKQIIQSFKLVDEEATPPPESQSVEDLLQQARVFMLVENKGQDALDLFPDKQLIETDAIGTGNGPIDYYYSERAHVTLKYERASNIVLNIQEGETTEF